MKYHAVISKQWNNTNKYVAIIPEFYSDDFPDVIEGDNLEEIIRQCEKVIKHYIIFYKINNIELPKTFTEDKISEYTFNYVATVNFMFDLD